MTLNEFVTGLGEAAECTHECSGPCNKSSRTARDMPPRLWPVFALTT